MVEIHAHVLSKQLENYFMQIHLHIISWTFAALAFAIAITENLSELLNELLQCCSNRLLFPQHTSFLKRSCPFRLSLSFLYDVSDQSETKTILMLTFWFWLWRRMFFLRELEFPQAASWACLLLVYFKAGTVPWLHVISAALAPDKSVEENPLELWML